jgi:hypothetical protein
VKRDSDQSAISFLYIIIILEINDAKIRKQILEIRKDEGDSDTSDAK